MIEIRFEVSRIKFRNPDTGYTIIDMKLLDHPSSVEIPTSERVVTGIFPVIHEKDEFIAKGKWIDSGKFGYQFESLTHTLAFPETSKGMIIFLRNSVEGVGAVLARRIVEEFKEATFSVIQNSPDELLKVKGITKKKRDSIVKSVNVHLEYEEVSIFLLGLGLSHIDSSNIYAEMGYSAISRIRENPYIITTLKGFPFKKADKIARMLDMPVDNPNRIYYGIIDFLDYRMESRGDMFTYLEDIYSEISGYIEKRGGYEFSKLIRKEDIDAAISDLIRFKKIKTEEHGNKTCVYIRFYNYVENSIVDKVIDKSESFNEWITHPDTLSSLCILTN